MNITCKRLSSVLLLTYLFLTIPTDTQADQEAAYSHLNIVMDQFNQSFDVYTDLAAAGNHFTTLCAIVRNPDSPAELAGVTLDECWAQNCRSGATCIKNTFSAIDSTYWGGWYFQNGVLLGSDTQPRCNWGDHADAGFDLGGATKLTFWARGELGGEKIEFFVGGIGRDPFTGEPVEPHPDSFPRVPPVGQVTTLTTEWQEYTIDLTGQDLSYVIGGFGWAADAIKNPNGATFYLDDIQYDKARPNELRFLVSYETLPVPPGDNFDTTLKNVAFTYDNTVALISFLARGTPDDLRRAALLADAFVYAQDLDRFWEDGRLRNAYQGGDLALPPGWKPNDLEGTARLPAWWDCEQQKWLENDDQVGTSTGNMAWVMIGLLRAHKILGNVEYLSAAERLGSWIEENTRDIIGAGGYTGGFEGGEPSPTPLVWKSTEHNICVYVAFMTLSDLTPEPEKSMWRERALHAKEFVRAMWKACDAKNFATGTKDDGNTNCGVALEDVNTWGLMALGEVTTYGRAIKWVNKKCRASERCPHRKRRAKGIDFNHDRDGIWWEGTAHTAIANMIRGKNKKAKFFLKHLRRAQNLAPNANGKGIVATCHDKVTTGFEDFFLFNRLHVAATAWYVLAEQENNPFWGISANNPIPHEGE
ncbi:MAG: hypothetical protein ACUZ77_05095 [Candidatus Brocadiales bacterium]